MTDLEMRVWEKAMNLADSANGQLVYLTHFGSYLYGTNIAGKSDTDIKGIFLPSRKSMLTNTSVHSKNYSSKKGGQLKNSTDDVDIDLWSVQKWLLELLPKGDVGAIDLLFSPSNKSCTLWDNGVLEEVFSNPTKFLNLSDSSGVVQYGVRQARKYGIKGSRLGALKKVVEFINNHQLDDSTKILDMIPDIVSYCGNEKYCCQLINNNAPAIRILGKIHSGGITFGELKERVNGLMDKYGDRTEKAMNNCGIDFKALSHAFRAIDEVESLLNTGKIEFPLKNREFMMNVKLGEYDWTDVEPLLEARLDEIMSKCEAYDSHYNIDYVRNVVVSMYDDSNYNFD